MRIRGSRNTISLRPMLAIVVKAAIDECRPLIEANGSGRNRSQTACLSLSDGRTRSRPAVAEPDRNSVKYSERSTVDQGQPHRTVREQSRSRSRTKASVSRAMTSVRSSSRSTGERGRRCPDQRQRSRAEPGERDRRSPWRKGFSRERRREGKQFHDRAAAADVKDP